MSRLDELNKMLASEPNDPFVLYGIAQEHAKAGRHRDAVGFYERCLEADPAYLYGYYHKAVSLIDLGEQADAGQTLQAGIRAAKAARDAKALNELSALLDSM